MVRTWPRPRRRHEFDAIELARSGHCQRRQRRALNRLEAATDDLAVTYAITPPADCGRARQHIGDIGRLLDARKTLDQHRRLLVLGGWLTLLGSTVYVDLGHRRRPRCSLATAGELADHAGHTEIAGWCLETRAWAC